MKLTVDTTSLMARLDKALLGLPPKKKESLPITVMFLCEIENEVMSITATDVERRIRVQLPVRSKDNFKFCAPGRLLTNTIELCREPETQFTLKVKDKSFVVEVKSGKNKYVLNGFDPEDFPRQSMSNCDSEITLQSSEFRKSLRMAENLVDKNEGREQLRGLHITEKNKNIEIVSATGFYLGKFRHSPRAIKSWAACTITPAMAKMIREAFGDKEVIDVMHNGKMLFVKSDNTMVCGMLLDQKYPDTDPFFNNKEFDTETELSTMEMLDAAKRLSLYSSDESPYIDMVSVTGSPNEILVTAVDEAFGNSGEEVIHSSNVINIDTRFNSKFVDSIISLIDEPTFKFFYSDTRKMAYICPTLTTDQELDREFVIMRIMK